MTKIIYTACLLMFLLTHIAWYYKTFDESFVFARNSIGIFIVCAFLYYKLNSNKQDI